MGYIFLLLQHRITQPAGCIAAFPSVMVGMRMRYCGIGRIPEAVEPSVADSRGLRRVTGWQRTLYRVWGRDAVPRGGLQKWGARFQRVRPGVGECVGGDTFPGKRRTTTQHRRDPVLRLSRCLNLAPVHSIVLSELITHGRFEIRGQLPSASHPSDALWFFATQRRDAIVAKVTR